LGGQRVINEFNVEDIESCANELHLKKARDRNELTIEHIIFAHPLIYCHLKHLFMLIFKHGHVPSEFKIGVITPVIKDKKKDVNDVDNYRPVTIISVISKLFEMCIYKRIGECLGVTGLQFGFVKDGGCEKSIFTVQNVVNYYVKRKSDVYVATLDASAAFDRVNIYGLLSKLIDRNVSFDVIRVLISWYCVSHACVRLGNVYTDYIDIKSGIKQGGIMSPILYNVYVDDLMANLLKETLGCTIGGMSYGVIFYADDILLMGASVRKVQKMIEKCGDYGRKYGISFNPKKSKWFCTKVYGNCDNVNFMLNGDVIEHESVSFVYLGVKLLMKRDKLVVDVNERIRKFNSSAYSVLLSSNDLTEVVRCEIIVKKCMPVLLYGLGYSDLCKDDLYKLYVAYRKIFRYIFKLSSRAHISDLLAIFGIKSVYALLEEKWNSILRRNLISRFVEVQFLANCCIRK
jgi:hypothetical protein